jgi:hypothetical protein
MGPPQRGQHWSDVGEQIGDADEIAQNPVAVHPHEWHELVQQLDVGEHDEDEQRRVVGAEENAVCRREDECVEVDATEVGSDPRSPPEAVDVGEVGVEDGPDEVDTDPHHPRGRATVAGRSGVPDLVESGGGEQQACDQEEQRGVAGEIARCRADADLSCGADCDVE